MSQQNTAEDTEPRHERHSHPEKESEPSAGSSTDEVSARRRRVRVYSQRRESIDLELLMQAILLITDDQRRT